MNKYLVPSLVKLDKKKELFMPTAWIFSKKKTEMAEQVTSLIKVITVFFLCIKRLIQLDLTFTTEQQGKKQSLE